MKSRQQNIVIFLLFVVFTLLFTYPLVLNVGSTLRGHNIDALGDPLFNTWTLAQNCHKLVHLNFKGFFDGNIFHPQSKTVLYSEILLPQTLMALPVYLLSANPVLAYNLVFLFGYILSGFGMFCLARHLTKSTAGGIVAGLIFAFCPFMIAHAYHLQIVSAWGIPFAFLYLHKYFENGRLKDLLLFTFFYVAQSLANGHYALFLTLFMGLWILYRTIVQKKFLEWRFWAHMFLFAGLSAAALGPIFYQYARVHAEMGFSRVMEYYARLSSYLVTPAINRLYGKISAPFFRNEGELFPGLVALALGLLGMWTLVKARKIAMPVDDRRKKFFFLVRRLINTLMMFTSIIIVAIIGQGGLDLKIGNFQILRAHNLSRSIRLLLLLLLARFILDKLFGFRTAKPGHPDERNLKTYAVICILAFLFTLGPTGPYLFLYKYVPGFNAIRGMSRFDIFVMFGLAVLAAYGLRNALAKIRSAVKIALTCLVVLAIGLEYLSIPIPYYEIPVKNQVLDVYKWLAETKKPGVLVELPFPPYDGGSAAIETVRMYYSTYHWNTLVNGYSGYFPPLYTELCRRYYKSSLKQLVDDFRTLKVNYVLFHLSEIKERLWPALHDDILKLNDELRFLTLFGNDYLYEVIPKPSVSGDAPYPANLKKLVRTGWHVRATAKNPYAPFVLDGDPKTRWFDGPQEAGGFFEIDLTKPAMIRCVSLKFSPSFLDFPRGYKMEVSFDGVRWTEVAREDQTVIPILAFAKPNETSLNIFLPAQEARFIRITNLGTDPVFYWSIYELDIYD